MDAFTGTIIAWPGTWAPQGWAFCDGSHLSIQQNAPLFSIIQFRYGGNYTSAVFHLPNLVGRSILGASTIAGMTLGEPGGSVTSSQYTAQPNKITLSTKNIPPHRHNVLQTLTGVTSIVVGTSQSDGVTIAEAGSVLTSTTGGNPNSAAIYLPANTKPTNPVKLGGITTSVSANFKTELSDDASPLLDVDIPPILSTVKTQPPFLALNYIICVNGIYPSIP